MSFERLHKQLFEIVNIIVFTMFLSGCTTIAPVQEMSNARQSIKAAKDANAENLAANVLSEAQQRLRSAMRELDAGEYERARILALEAKHLALKAKQLAVSSSNKVN
jgi:PBP1b-binding outer membrane lipoprotein LpoB